jgi:SRSO17 transposase
MDGLAKAAGRADREAPLKAYCAGLLLPGERKSVEPMAARVAPDNVRRAHQSLHDFVADAPWNDEAMLETVRGWVLPRMKENGPVVAWIVGDTGFVKKGKHSVGVARQYCGPVGKQENCQVAVSLSVTTAQASLPIAWRMYLPESWAGGRERRKATGVPGEILLQTKPAIALAQIRRAVAQEVPTAPILADSAYGNDTRLREGIAELGLPYVAGVHENMTVWPPGEAPRPKPRRKGRGRPPTRLHRDAEHQPVSVKQLALPLPRQAWKTVTWRQGNPRRTAIAFCGRSGASCSPGSEAQRAVPGRMAVDRMASGGSRTRQVLAFDAAGPDPAEGAGELGQAPLDH